MDTTNNYCQKCGKPLKQGALFCGNCGEPAPGAYFFTPEGGSAAEKPKQKRGARFWFGLVSLIGGSLTSCGSLIAIAVYLLGGSPGGGGTAPAAEATLAQPTAPLVATSTMLLPTLETTATPEATSNPIPEGIVTMTPGQPEPAILSGVGGTSTPQAGTYTEDFDDVNSGWGRLYEDTFNLDYAPDSNYRIELKMPDKMVTSRPAYPFERPLFNTTTSVKAKGEVGNGYYGILCHYQDDNNYYRAGMANGYYTVNKMVNGTLSYLTDPPWKPILLYEPGEDGYNTITLACEDGRIQLLIDDIGQEIFTDVDLLEGHVALFVSAGNQPDAEGVYMRGYFDDFSMEVR